MDYKEQQLLKHVCLNSHLAFTRYFFKHREGAKFIVNPHHVVMAKTLDRVFTGEIKRLIINVPPGYTKTEMAVIAFIARGLAINPQAKFIHTSYSDPLALDNSMVIRDVITSEEYQTKWPMRLRKDKTAKGRWMTEHGGSVLAAASGGSITGFRAGRMCSGFSGAMISDDPLKPDDAYSEAKRTTVNNRIMNTLRNRLAHSDVPMIFIMQRLHEDDASAFLLGGGTGEKWHHLLLNAAIEKDFKYPDEYKYGIPIKHNLKPGPLWAYKETLESLAVMRKADPYTTAAQFDQNPTPLGGGIFKDHWWGYYNPDVLPEMEYRFITADTAQKTAEHNDYSVFGCWGVSGNKILLLDVVRGKWESPELRQVARDFYAKHRHRTAPRGRLRVVAIEDKASGTDLIQTLDAEMPIEAIQRNVDKVTRAMDTVPYVTAGRVLLPKEAAWLSDFKDEVRKFTPKFTHKYDDQVDMFMDGVEIGLMEPALQAGSW